MLYRMTNKLPRKRIRGGGLPGRSAVRPFHGCRRHDAEVEPVRAARRRACGDTATFVSGSAGDVPFGLDAVGQLDARGHVQQPPEGHHADAVAVFRPDPQPLAAHLDHVPIPPPVGRLAFPASISLQRSAGGPPDRRDRRSRSRACPRWPGAPGLLLLAVFLVGARTGMTVAVTKPGTFPAGSRMSDRLADQAE